MSYEVEVGRGAAQQLFVPGVLIIPQSSQLQKKIKALKQHGIRALFNSGRMAALNLESLQGRNPVVQRGMGHKQGLDALTFAGVDSEGIQTFGHLIRNVHLALE